MRMKLAFLRPTMFVIGLALALAALSPGGAGRSLAAPGLLITETATEPATPTPTSTPTNTATVEGQPPPPPTQPPPVGSPTSTPTIDPSLPPRPPTDTPQPADTPQSTMTSIPIEEEEPPSSRNTPEPTATAITPTPLPPTVTPGPVLIPDLLVTKSVDRREVQIGDTIEFTIVVINQGNAPASNVVVEDNLPAFLELVSASSTRGEVTTSGQLVRVTIDTLQPGEQVEITIVARVSNTALPGENSNIAVVNTGNPNEPTDNNTDQATFIVQPPAGPVSLPATGTQADHAAQLWLLLAGLALISASLLFRRKA